MGPMSDAVRAAVVVVALAGAAAGTRAALQPVANAAGATLRDPSFLPDGRALRAASLGQRHVLADYYWLSLVQNVGVSTDRRNATWNAVFPYADLVTDLDPRYGYAYQEAGGLLSGVAHKVDLSDRILLKGLAAVPDRWQISWNLGFNKYFYERDLRAAAAYFDRAAEVGKRPHLRYQSAALAMSASGEEDYDFAIHALDVALREADSDVLRRALEERLVQARTYKALAEVERAADAHRARTGSAPASIQELVSAGLLPAVPADPAGGRIVLDPATGKARSTVLGGRTPILKGIP
jgi:tetratricopeptide (TPR) repeat protein